jgi:glucose-1-phosphate cytidylyltransferase
MKVVILAGGVGSRLSEETELRPKPMVEIGGRPILWHIMKHYAQHGFDDFVICLGYKGEHIKRFFSDSLALSSDMTIDFASGTVSMHEGPRENWRVTLVDTGLHTEMTGRLLRIRELVAGETFLMTYGDGVSDVDIAKEVEFHREHGRVATMTAVRPVARFGHMEFDGDVVVEFNEKPQMAEGWINGGFFVLEPGFFDFVPGDVSLSKPLELLAAAGQLVAYRHEGFWQCMDTLRDKIYLNSLWDRGEAPWRTWA